MGVEGRVDLNAQQNGQMGKIFGDLFLSFYLLSDQLYD